MIGDNITLSGLNYTLQNYVTNDSLATNLANKITTETEHYLKKVDLFTNSIRLGWKESGGDQTLMVPNLATLQALVARVELLEVAVQTLQTQQSAGELARDTIESTQETIWNFTQFAFERIVALEEM